MSDTLESEEGQKAPSPIASYWHLAGNLLIIAGMAYWGWHLQQSAPAAGSAYGQLIDHSQALKNYLIDILADCGLLYYCWVGVHWHGGTMETLTRGRWLTWKGLMADVAIAVPFFVIWEGTAYGVHWLLERSGGADTAKSVTAMLPRSALEIVAWIVVSIVAGVSEEIQSRGYMQQQLHALSGSIVFAVVAQGVLFGIGHSYQGWRQVIVISILGILYGALAAWRRNLRANMIVHAWSDVWEGWLRWVVFR